MTLLERASALDRRVLGSPRLDREKAVRRWWWGLVVAGVCVVVSVGLVLLGYPAGIGGVVVVGCMQLFVSGYWYARRCDQTGTLPRWDPHSRR